MDLGVLEKVWHFYFPEEGDAFRPDDLRVAAVESFYDFLVDHRRELKLEAGLGGGGGGGGCGATAANGGGGGSGGDAARSFHFNFNDLMELCTDTPIHDLPAALQNHPSETLNCLGLAVCVLRAKVYGIPVPLLRRINMRIHAVQPFLPFSAVRANMVNKLVSIRGTALRVSPVRPIVRRMNWQCATCGAQIDEWLVDGKYVAPKRCSDNSCRSRKFNPDRDSALIADWQKIKLQEIDDDKRDAGRVPRTVEVELTEDLVHTCVPGDVIVVAGVVKAMSIEEKKGGGGGKPGSKAMYLLYIDAISVTKERSTQQGEDGEAQDAAEVKFSHNNLRFVLAVAQSPNPMELIVSSVCPEIFGHDFVKFGLTLALFGGVAKYADEVDNVHVRGDIHVLVVGDPGLGKSEMLKAVHKLAPRGIYVCGTTTSSSGLTVTLVRDTSSGEFGLEAGALVLGDQGVVCIDEFDKMGSEQQALLEAMEQQRISVAKAGIVCSLSARSSVIAAANPRGGHYNRAKTVCENLKMSAPLLSRFDIVFILLDDPAADQDQFLSEHILSLHSRGGGAARANSGAAARRRMMRKRKATASQSSSSQGGSQHDGGAGEGAGAPCLRERLERAATDNRDPIPPQLLRKYIAYARKYVRPQLSREASDVLKAFFLELRAQQEDADSTPVTTRQLESLIRLAQARARIELAEVVTRAHAHDVVEVLKASLLDAMTDEFGNVDYSRSASGMSKSKQVKMFVAALHKSAQSKGSALFSVSEIKQLINESPALQRAVTNPEDFIELLNHQNYILKKGARLCVESR